MLLLQIPVVCQDQGRSGKDPKKSRSVPENTGNSDNPGAGRRVEAVQSEWWWARLVISLFSRKSKTLLGVDVSSTAVKVVDLSRRADTYRLENYAIRALPDNAVQEKNIQDQAAVAESIHQAVSLLKPGTREAAIAVAGSAVITKVIEMNAALNDAEMENQIVVEADQYIPYPLSEVAIDFERQPRNDPESDLVDVLLAACRKENVDARVAALEDGGLRANVVDIEAFAMERAYGLLEQQMSGPPETVAVVDIGASVTTINVLHKGRTIYTREQMFGGKQLQEEVQMRFSLSPAEAEAGIKRGNLPEEYGEQVLEPFRESVAEQVSRSLQFFFSSSHYNEVDRIVLCGGVAAMQGLAERVEESLDTPVMQANPFRNLQVSDKVNKTLLANDAPSLMIACGLAMRGRY